MWQKQSGQYSEQNFWKNTRSVIKLYFLWRSQNSEQPTYESLAGLGPFFFIISFSICYNRKWSYFYLHSLFLLRACKFHKTHFQLDDLNFLFIHSRLQSPELFEKIISQARAAKSSFFCKLWKRKTFIVIHVGEGGCDNKR